MTASSVDSIMTCLDRCYLLDKLSVLRPLPNQRFCCDSYDYKGAHYDYATFRIVRRNFTGKLEYAVLVEPCGIFKHDDSHYLTFDEYDSFCLSVSEDDI
ncbi:hypothetical protein [Tortoise microvirus 16]|nr:hypothetical protein [Tortoise microvirus 16]QCS37049.1 hypothetical protein [Tortoise microvirus 45]